MLKRLCLLSLLCVLLGLTPDPCPAQVIGEIRVEGTLHSDPSEVLRVVKTPIGASLSSSATQRSISEDLKRVHELGTYNPLSIRAEVEGTEALQTLVIHVEEYPLVTDIRYVGNTKYKEDRLDEEIGFEEGEKLFMRPGLVDQLKEKIEAFYFSKGFSNVIIEGREGEKTEAGVTLEFVIEEGRKLKLQSVGFEGNVYFTPEDLEEEIKTKPKSFGLFRRKFDEQQFDEDMKRLEFLYQRNGFLEAKVQPGTRRLVKDDKRLAVNFDINEGPQYRLGKIEIEGASTFSRAEMLQPITVQRGDIFDRPQMLKDLQEVRNLYWYQGYRLANVEPDIIPDRETGIADLNLRVSQGPRFRLRDVRVQGVGQAADGSTFSVPMETKDYVVRREIPMQTGEVLDWSVVEEAQRKLINLQYFEREQEAIPPRLKHGFTFEPVPGTNQADLLVELEETNTGFIQFGGGFSTDVGPTLNLEFKDRNAFGRGWTYSLGGELGSKRSSIDLSFFNPRLNNTLWSTRYRLFYTQRDRIGARDFGEKRIGGAFTLGRQLTDTVRASVGYKLERVELDDIDDNLVLRDPEAANAGLEDRLFNEDPTVTSSIDFGVSRDTRDYVFFPTQGYHDILGLELAGLGGDNKFVKLEGTFDRFLKIRENLVFAMRLNFALANPYGDTEDLPLHERFFLGGSSSVRGFRSGGISPIRVVRRRFLDIDGNEIFADDDVRVGGESEWFTNLELRYRYSDTIQQVVFFDAGDVFEEATDIDFGTTRAAVGTGLRLNLFSNALIRLDLGFPVAKEDEDKTQSFQFNFGASF